MYLYGIHPAWAVIVSPIIMYFVGGTYKLVINKVVDRDLLFQFGYVWNKYSFYATNEFAFSRLY